VFLSIAAKVSTVFQQLQTDETHAKPAEDSQTNGNINTNLNPNQKKSKKFSSYSAMAPRPQSKLQSSWGQSSLGGS